MNHRKTVEEGENRRSGMGERSDGGGVTPVVPLDIVATH